MAEKGRSILRYQLTLFIVVCFSVLFCSSAQKEKSTEKKTARDLIEEYQSRESNNLTPYTIQSMTGVNMLSSGDILAEKIDEKSYFFSIPIGSESPMECSLLEGNQSPAYVLRNLHEKVKSNKSLTQVLIKSMSSGILGNLPYIYMETEYLTNEKLYGVIKSISLSSIGFVLMCYHDELGYSKTFKTVAESFAESEKVKTYLKKIQKYKKRDIQEITYNDKPIGFVENFWFEINDKEINYYTISNYLIPRDNDILAGELIEDLYVEKGTGNITSGKYYSYKNEIREYEIFLTEISSGNYKAQGVFRDEQVLKEFHPDQKIVFLDYILENLVKENKEKKDSIIKIYQYHASYPDQLPLSELKVISLGSNEGKFNFSSGPVSMDLDVDQKGVSIVKVVNQNAAMVTRRIFSESP